jgi:DNA-binding transcriptional LysR family regulator
MTDSGYIPPLSWLLAFHTAAEYESFSRAAEILGRSQATVSQQIKNLEAKLAVKLFYRRPRGVELTADGAAYLPHLRSAFDTIATSTRDLFASPREHSVTLASPVSINGLWLAPRLAVLNRQRPHIKLSIATIQRPMDYEVEDAELEIHYGDGNWPGYDKALLLPEILSPVCAPELLRSQKPWRELPILALVGARAGWSDWCEQAGVLPLAPPQYRFDSLLPALAAARAGAGVLLASLPLIEQALDAGCLVRLSEVELATYLGHWITRDRHKVASQGGDDLWAWLTKEAGHSRASRNDGSSYGARCAPG